jgi:hypothetical protein
MVFAASETGLSAVIVTTGDVIICLADLVSMESIMPSIPRQEYLKNLDR